MKFYLITCLSLAVSSISCSFNDNQCEDVTLASEQIQACQSLQKKIAQAKGKPILRTELERRYQQDCIDVRYYRDDHQTAVCGHDGKVKEATISPVTNNEN
jgi:hypothetical protein